MAINVEEEQPPWAPVVTAIAWNPVAFTDEEMIYQKILSAPQKIILIGRASVNAGVLASGLRRTRPGG